jgi:prepilin-type N-terminal cleavage/methylation domain-containing protein
MKNPRLSSRGGFTLVEILVVVAIIGVLAVIGIGASSTLLDRGADAQDLSNLRQIGTAISQFASENNGRIPNRNVPVTGDSQNRDSFMESVDRYMERDSRFSANSIYNWNRRPVWYSKRFAQAPPGRTFNTNNQYYWGTAWGMNSHLYYNSGSANMNNFQGYLNRVPNLSKLVIVGEKNRAGGHDFIPSQAPTFERNVESSFRISRPGQRAYYLFGDYHIESIAGNMSSSVRPDLNNFNPTNPLYYRW